jgi:hypothetical protein
MNNPIVENLHFLVCERAVFSRCLPLQNPKFNYMKKAIMFIALVATSVVGAQAQKFQGGEKNLEVNFSPLSANPIGINGIRFRMFNSESSAIRVGFNIGGGKATNVRVQPAELGTVTTPELYSTRGNFNFSIRPGYEKHFAGTDRLSPYVGAELAFTMGSSSHTEEYHSGNSDATVADPANWSTWTIERKEGSTTFGLNALAGVDFYFADNFYLGVEMTLGFASTKQKDSEISVSDENAFVRYVAAVDPSFDDMLDVVDGKMKVRSIVGNDNGVNDFKDMNWAPNAQGTLRLGWLF